MSIKELTKQYIKDVTETAKSTSTENLKKIIDEIQNEDFIAEIDINNDLKILVHIFKHEYKSRITNNL